MRAITSKAIVTGLTCLSLLAGAAARAQSPAAPAAAPTSPAAPAAVASRGPLIAGVCLLSREEMIGRSKIGAAMTARLRELAQQTQANINADKARLVARQRAFEAKRATLSPQQFEAQGQALMQSLNQKAQADQAEAQERFEATKSNAVSRVLQQAAPFVDQAYAAHGCGLLFTREAVISGNLGNDLTPEVVAALDAKATLAPFDLEPARPAK